MAIAPLPDPELLGALTATRPPLRLLPFPGGSSRAADPVVPGPPVVGPPRRAMSSARRARLRRTALVALLVGLLGALAVPVRELAGTTGAPPLVPGDSYVVRAGDTLSSIAGRLGSPAEQASLVRAMAAETGSVNVVPGEHLVLP